MPKEPVSRKAKSGSHTAAAKASMQSRLDRLDRDLVKALNERAELARQIESATDSNGEATPLPDGMGATLEQVVAHSKGPLSAECVRSLFRELISGGRAIDRKLRVAFLGPIYTYSHIATLQRFGSHFDPRPVSSIAAVFEEVNRGHADFGMVPIENSTDGRIADTLDMFTRLRVKICGQVMLPIHHCLLARCARSDVSEVYSRTQPLSQCRNWLSTHLPGARIVEVTSTAVAAQLAQEKQGAAAIASRQAGAHYALDVLSENIEDQKSNVTRFAVIGEQSAARTGRDTTAVMFEVPHKPGSLADAMAIFKRNRLNLTWIESFPIQRQERGYIFFVELEGHETDAKVRKALDSLERRAIRLETLGSCPRCEQAS